ncbi:MAG: hypothetical protein ACRDRA_08520 [Pseudonocardiaceae bacterium]
MPERTAQRTPNVDPRESVVRFTVDPRSPDLDPRSEVDRWREGDVRVASDLLVVRR